MIEEDIHKVLIHMLHISNLNLEAHKRQVSVNNSSSEIFKSTLEMFNKIVSVFGDHEKRILDLESEIKKLKSKNEKL